MVEKKEYKKNGIYHREDGPAVIFDEDNTQWWWEGKLHRDGGPAIETKNINYYFREGNRHREDGAAVEYKNGFREYWYNGERIEANNLKEYLRIIKLITFK